MSKIMILYNNKIYDQKYALNYNKTTVYINRDVL